MDANGLVTAKKKGNTKITVKTYNGKKASVIVEVTDDIAPESVAIDQAGPIEIDIGETAKLTATLSPAGAASGLKWTTSDSAVAVISEAGVLRGISEGTATITVTADNGVSDSIEARVTGQAVPLSIESLSADADQRYLGEAVKWTAEAKGGNGALEYAFEIYASGSMVSHRGFSGYNSIAYMPEVVGEYSAKVTVRDELGNTVEKSGGEATVISFPFEYYRRNDGLHITGYEGGEGSLIIPSTYAGVPIVEIWVSAFKTESNLTGNLVIPDSVKSICLEAFMECSGFTGSLSLSKGLVSLGKEAFRDCTGFTGNLSLPDSLTSISSNVFLRCSGFTGSLSLPKKLISIDTGAFSGCSGFTGSLSLPESLTSIGNEAFSECSGFTGALTFPDGLTSIGNCAFRNCTGFFGELILPQKLSQVSESAFEGCTGFTGGLNVPHHVDRIEEKAFSGCTGLTSVTIGYGTSYIADNAFSGCSNLSTIYGYAGTRAQEFARDKGITFVELGSGYPLFDYIIKDSIAVITKYNGHESTVTVPNKLENIPVVEIGDGAFALNKEVSKVILPSTIKRIGHRAFRQSALNSINFPEGLTEIGDYAFDNSNEYKEFKLPSSLVSIGAYAFSNISIECDLKLPSSLKHLGRGAFYESKIKGSIKFPDSLKTIPDYAFYNCYYTTGSLILPKELEFIGDDAFYNCSGFRGDLVIPNGVTHIGNYAFEETGFTGTLKLSDELVEIGSFAFCMCSFKGKLKLPAKLKTIGSCAFYYCNRFTGGLTLPVGLETVGGGAFSGCTGFNGSLVIPNTLMLIDSEAFASCGFKGELTIPDSVQRIGEFAFAYCDYINGVLRMPKSDNYLRIERNTFQYAAITGVIMPPNIISVDNYAFEYCKNLKTIFGEPGSYAETYAKANNLKFEKYDF